MLLMHPQNWHFKYAAIVFGIIWSNSQDKMPHTCWGIVFVGTVGFHGSFMHQIILAKNMFHQQITFFLCFVSLVRTFVIKTPGLFNKQTFEAGSDIYCCYFFPPFAPFLKHVIPIFFLSPFKSYRWWNTDICAVRRAFCLSHSLSLGVQLRGLVCAWVPRIMITAAEKHIFTFQEIRAGNLQAEDLTSSLWLIVELTEKSPPTTNNWAAVYPQQEEHPLLLLLQLPYTSPSTCTPITAKNTVSQQTDYQTALSVNSVIPVRITAWLNKQCLTRSVNTPKLTAHCVPILCHYNH